jgi:hypothetical protein
MAKLSDAYSLSLGWVSPSQVETTAGDELHDKLSSRQSSSGGVLQFRQVYVA